MAEKELWIIKALRDFFGEADKPHEVYIHTYEKFPRNHMALGVLYGMTADVMRGQKLEVGQRDIFRGLKKRAFEYDYRIALYSEEYGFSGVTAYDWRKRMTDAAIHAMMETHSQEPRDDSEAFDLHMALMVQIWKTGIALNENYEVY